MLDAVERVGARRASPLALCRSLADFAATDRDRDEISRSSSSAAVRPGPAEAGTEGEKVRRQIEGV